MLNRRELVAGLALAAGSARSGFAQTYPTQPIRMLVGYPAGGGVDIVARLLGEPMKAALGQPVIVENRTGAAAMIAANAVAKAAPDGQTLLMVASGEVAINHHLYKEKMTYDPARELVPIALVGIVPCVVVVKADSPVKTPQDLVAYAKANPGKLSFSSSGIGNPQQLAGELMNAMAGIDVLHVPYRGSAPAVTDVATGAVTMSFSSLAASLALIQDGKLRAVAVTSRERMPQLPDVAPLVRRRAGAGGLRTAQLVRDVRHRRDAGADRHAAQRDRRQGARRSEDRRDADRAGHRAAGDDAGRVQGVRRFREPEIRRHHRARQDHAGEIAVAGADARRRRRYNCRRVQIDNGDIAWTP